MTVKAYIERIEALETERRGLGEDIRSIYKEAKDAGFKSPILRAIVRLRRLPSDERAEQQALIDRYMAEMGQ